MNRTLLPLTLRRARRHATSVTLALAAALAAAPPALAAGKHEHGVARLDVAVEPTRISFDLQVPQDAVVGFERTPRNEAERNKAASALAKLRDAAALFRIDGGGGCTAAKTEVDALLLQPDAVITARGGHADVDGRYEFRCTTGGQARFVEVGLFEAFPSLKRIELQLVTPRGQIKATLARPATRVALVR